MLIKAFEVTGLEGTYKYTCEKVLQVLRHDKDSLVAVLEAFVYDPLLNWNLNYGLTNASKEKHSPTLTSVNQVAAQNDLISMVNTTATNLEAMTLESKDKLNEEILYSNLNQNPTINNTNTEVQLNNESKYVYQERLNKRALSVINRIMDKLTGRDFDKKVQLNVEQQVDLLIKQATSNENLCQLYIGI